MLQRSQDVNPNVITIQLGLSWLQCVSYFVLRNTMGVASSSYLVNNRSSNYIVKDWVRVTTKVYTNKRFCIINFWKLSVSTLSTSAKLKVQRSKILPELFILLRFLYIFLNDNIRISGTRSFVFDVFHIFFIKLDENSLGFVIRIWGAFYKHFIPPLPLICKIASQRKKTLN